MRRQTYDVMDLKALRCFYVMIQRGSVSQASIELGISEAAVSQRIKLLETYLKVKLYESRGGHVRITGAGELVFTFSMTIFDEISTFENQLAVEGAGEVSLSAHDSILRYLLPNTVKVFRQEYPLVQLRLLSRPVEETLRLVRANELDFGIVAQRRLAKELHFQAIATYSSCLIMKKGHKLASVAKEDIYAVLSKEILDEIPLIFQDSKQEGSRLVEVLANLELPISASLEVGTVNALKHYVSLGLGISVISALSLTAEDRVNLEVIPLPTELDSGTTYGIVSRYDKRQNMILSRFIELLINSNQ
ncbi:LysR family transcriptional regulator [Moritella sp. F3]|uniref:LysR family transcriptional regulator n=1 Tax=Moritella sp. F3 TaxID=2718882 RepID=UPI0018E0D40F|nr:LysR family transcriptional regulator [Moritella sp. F3]